MEPGQGRWQLGPGKLHVWSVKPVRDLTVSSLYKELLEYVHSDIRNIKEAYRLRHLEDLKHTEKFVSISQEKETEEYPLHAFPGSIPYSLMRSEIPKLYTGAKRYVYLYKGDGQRLLLYFARIRGRPIVFFMTRPGFFCLLPSIRNLPEQLFEGTKLDVELIYQPETESRRLEVFDNLATCGHVVGHYNFLKRLHLTHYLVQFLNQKGITTTSKVIDSYSPLNNYEVPYSPRFPTLAIKSEEQEMMDELGIPQAFKEEERKQRVEKSANQLQSCSSSSFMLGPYCLVPKRAYSVFELHHLLFEVLPKMPHYAQEGLIGMPDEDPVMPGPCRNIVKIKIGRRLNTCDLLCGAMEDPMQIGWWAELPARHKIEDAGKRQIVAWRDTKIVLIGTGRRNGPMQQLVREDGTAPRLYKWEEVLGKIVECRMDTQGEWEPVRLRDKRKPNTLETCLRTMENMDLTYRDIFPFLDPTQPGPVLKDSQRAMQLNPDYVPRILSNSQN